MTDGKKVIRFNVGGGLSVWHAPGKSFNAGANEIEVTGSPQNKKLVQALTDAVAAGVGITITEGKE